MKASFLSQAGQKFNSNLTNRLKIQTKNRTKTMTKATLLKILAISAVGLGAIAAFSMTQSSANAGSPGPQAAPAPIEALQAAEALVSGTFTGRSDHVTSGQVSIVKTATGFELVLADNFFLDGAPDPVIGFGTNDKFDKATIFTKLEKTAGGQTYVLPADFVLGNNSQVFVWCEQFSVPLGVADLS
jgi:hypothetical protein